MGRPNMVAAYNRVLRLTRRYLEAGVMLNGVVMERHEGTPQGGPLSPLLANVLLDEVDKELEKRGHAFVRYADDGNVYVRSRRDCTLLCVNGHDVHSGQEDSHGPARRCGQDAR